MVKLCRDLHVAHASPTTRVEFCTWSDDFSGLAELIWRCNRDNPSAAAVYVYAYSWGGASAMVFARELMARGLVVRVMVLSDPVYRSPWCLRWWRALWPWSRIYVPENVMVVRWFRQTSDWPRGHTLDSNDYADTLVFEAVVMPHTRHKYMDDLPAFHERCRLVAEAA